MRLEAPWDLKIFVYESLLADSMTDQRPVAQQSIPEGLQSKLIYGFGVIG